MKMIAMLAALAIGAQTAPAETLADICGACVPEKVVICGRFLEGINFDRDGHIWAVSLKNGEILEIANGQCQTRAKTGGLPNGARFHKDGRLFVTDNVRGIIAFDPKSGAIQPFADSVAGRKMVDANDLVFDADGGLYVTVPGGSHFLDRKGQVVYFAPGSTTATVIADHLPYPNGIALTPDGKFVIVGLYGDKTIMEMPSVPNAKSTRQAYVLARTEGGVGPDGMTMDADGRLYFAEFLHGAVGVTDTDGVVLGYIKLPPEAGKWTTNVAFHDGYLYVTEGAKGEIWRVAVKTVGQTLYYHP